MGQHLGGPRKVIFHIFAFSISFLKKPPSLCSTKVTKTKRGPPGAENLVFTNLQNSEIF